MRKALIAGILLAVLLPVLPQPVAAMTGSGIPGDPYMIYDDYDLQDMDLALDAWYELANDIDASNTTNWNGGAGFDPVGTSGTPFTGHFNGNGYTISDLTINRPSSDYIGLFGYVDGGSGDHVTIDNVILTGINYTGDDQVGGLVGEAFTYTDISYCEVWGIITSGSADPTNTGGLIGYSGADYTNETNNITRCRAVVNVDGGGTSGNGGQAGGFIGRADKATVISECCAYGNVSSHNDIGGFVGTQPYGTISDCFAFGDVTMTDNAGIGAAQDGGGFLGVCGGFGGKPYRCYSIGTVYCLDAHGCTNKGCFAGQVTTSCTACFWDKQVTSCTSSACGTGKFTWEMMLQSTFETAGWDFDTIWAIDPAINAGYPYLQWTWDMNQVVWFQPIDIIHGTTLPNRAGYEDGVIVWGGNPSGVLVEHGIWAPEDEYEFDIITPGGQDIIIPTTPATVDVDIVRLRGNPLYPLIQIMSVGGILTERLAWLLLAWLIVIGAMFLVHIGPDTHRGSKKPHHFVLTTITGLGLTILFYVMGIFPWPVILAMALGLVGGIVWERQPVI